MNHKKITNGKYGITTICFICYIIAAVVTVTLFFVSLSIDEKDAKPYAFSETWYSDAEMTRQTNIRHPVLENGNCTFYSHVPVNIQKGDCLWFKAKNAFITVKIGGEERAWIDEDDTSALYGKGPGTDWVCVPLETGDSGARIEIDFHTNYSDGSAYIDDVSIGSALSSLRTTFSGMAFGTILCILMIFFGLILIMVFLAIRPFVKQTPIELMYLGFFMLFVSVWSMAELRVFQLFTDKDGGIFHNFSCMAMMLIVMPLVLYFKKDLDRKNRFIVPAMTVLTMLNCVVCNVLHFMGIADFHQTLICTQITVGVGAVVIIYANILRLFKNPERLKADIPPAVCAVLVAVGGVMDVIMYNSGRSKDSAFCTRIAISLYAVSLSINSVMYIIRLMRMGMKADIVARLAYEDGLTGLGNRTAYSERLEEIQGKPSTIFVFNINNLKYVNDNIGHQAGDELIKAGADIIASVFGKTGRCYRTGGDEFVCIAENAVDGESLSEEFYVQIRAFNATGVLGFPLMIALGFEVYNGETDIKTVIDFADHKMYQKKEELKRDENGKYARKDAG